MPLQFIFSLVAMVGMAVGFITYVEISEKEKDIDD